ncbi:hypothetical protein RB195_015936 [Necator americanus]|uniref:Transmembrane protein n=1 Tax=Necator americanus TaxID=51031 RepID=A0ABR1E7F9_NECAM
MLVARCAQRLPLLIHRRHISLSSSSYSVLNNVWDRVKGLFTENDKENFHEEFIRRSHKSDRINSDEWMLIYRDHGASRSFFVISVAFPLFLAGLAIFGYEVSTKPQTERNKFVQRLAKDAEEVGLLAILPAITASIVIFFLLRIHQLRILRIYQNKKSVNEYLAVGPKRLLEKHQIPFSREYATACYFADEKTGFARILAQALLGNMQIKNRRFLISDDAFLANNYRSYMLNETSTPPRLR